MCTGPPAGRAVDWVNSSPTSSDHGRRVGRHGAWRRCGRRRAGPKCAVAEPTAVWRQPPPPAGACPSRGAARGAILYRLRARRAASCEQACAAGTAAGCCVSARRRRWAIWRGKGPPPRDGHCGRLRARGASADSAAAQCRGAPASLGRIVPRTTWRCVCAHAGRDAQADALRSTHPAWRSVWQRSEVRVRLPRSVRGRVPAATLVTPARARNHSRGLPDGSQQ